MNELTARLAPDRLTTDGAAALIPSWELVLRAERKSPETIKVYGDGLRRYLLWCAERGTGRRHLIWLRLVLPRVGGAQGVEHVLVLRSGQFCRESFLRVLQGLGHGRGALVEALLRWSIGSGATLCHDLAFGLRVRWFPFPS
ncbi:MAG: hypothetical protein WKF73_07585 [Nocardioidaceae bacterium]